MGVVRCLCTAAAGTGTKRRHIGDCGGCRLTPRSGQPAPPKEHGFSFADQRLAQDTIDCQPAYPTHQMGTSYRFISAPSDSDAVLTWFRELPEPPREIAAAQHIVLYFAHLGGLQYGEEGEVDAEKSPIVTIVPPRTARGALWTVGEVHFLTSALGKLYPALYRVSRSFGKWLGGYQCVYSSADRDNGYSYYLEGSVKNQVTPIFALQSGMDALGNERYFVGARDNDAVLDTVCKTLRLRGLSVDAG